jgi:hypothetical protein
MGEPEKPANEPSGSPPSPDSERSIAGAASRSFDRAESRSVADRPMDKAALPRTPALDRLIDRAGRRLLELVWLHGLSTATCAFALWLAFAFIADWTLHLPAGVRWIHLGLLLAAPVFFLVRDLVRPLRSLPRRAGLAVLVERAHPELDELLVSAVELSSSTRPSGAPELVAGVMREADLAAEHLDLARVFDARRPRLRMLCGVLAIAACTLLFSLDTDATHVFFQRLAGGDTPWPQRTHLSIEVPISGAAVQTAAADGSTEASAPVSSSARREIVVRVARGSDVPVIVRAEGVVPEDVTLHFTGGHQVVLSASGGSVFRTLLRSCQENVEFYATGGDDQDDDPTVKLVVLQPPDVSGLAIAIEPPRYSGQPAHTDFDRDVEVLAGSKLLVHVLVSPSEARGVARLLPEDRVVELKPSPFPVRPAASSADAAAPTSAETSDAKTTKNGLGFELTAEKSLRYRFELTDSTGLSNPDPGLFGIAVIEDRPPEVEILSPGRGDFDTVMSGWISLRARAEDDFGITSMGWSSAPISESESAQARAPKPLEFQSVSPTDAKTTPAAPPASAAGSASGQEAVDGRDAPEAHRSLQGSSLPVRAVAIARKRIEAKELGAGEAVVEGQQFQLLVSALDNCEPKAHEGRSAPVRVRVVSTDEFMRRIQDRLARAQASAAALSELQREKSRRALDLFSVIESDQLVPEGAGPELSAALVGERRVQGDARALSRELSAILESVLYARVDDRAGALLDFIDQRLAQATGRGFDPAPWRELAAAWKQGTLGAAGLAGKLLEITSLSLEISEDLSGSASDALVKAQDTVDLARLHTELGTAIDLQKQAVVKIERLLELLSEWDNFQSVLSLTRDILNGERNLSDRTKQVEKEH